MPSLIDKYGVDQFDDEVIEYYVSALNGAHMAVIGWPDDRRSIEVADLAVIA